MPNMDQERLPIRGSLAAVDRNSLTKMYREFGDRWEIEQIPPGVRWIAVYRENNDEYIRLVLAHDVGGLRYCMTEAENETPEEREEQGT